MNNKKQIQTNHLNECTTHQSLRQHSSWKNIDNLSIRMKEIEKSNEKYIKPYIPFVLRLDGKKFSKFTKGFMKPFDDIFVKAMVSTMNDLLIEFNAMTAYTHSDEISLIFSNVCSQDEYDNKINNKCHIFNGRLMKLCSITAGYCSTRFCHHIKNQMKNRQTEYDDKRSIKIILEKLNNPQFCFDSRILIFEEKKEELLDHMIWRSIKDSERNCISNYGQQYIGHENIFGLKPQEIVDKLSQNNILWNGIPFHLKYGIYAKKEKYIKYVIYNCENKKVTRTRVKNFCFKIEKNDEMMKLLLEPYITHNIEDKILSFEILDYNI